MNCLFAEASSLVLPRRPDLVRGESGVAQVFYIEKSSTWDSNLLLEGQKRGLELGESREESERLIGDSG